MKLNDSAIVFSPNGEDISATTHLCFAAHQDDIELMAYGPIAECFQNKKSRFTGVVTADGAGSPRTGVYADYTDDDMKNIRIKEQKKAAEIGDYNNLIMLGYPSKIIKSADGEQVAEDYAEILRAAKPKYVFTHNFADKHDTHCGVALKVVDALRKLKKSERPEKLYGCEVWRGLDWLRDSDKTVMDVSHTQNIRAALLGVFDSQISGGKRYDLAIEGRFLANATFFESHGTDMASHLSFALDMTKLIEDDSISPYDFIAGYIDSFKSEVEERLNRSGLKK